MNWRLWFSRKSVGLLAAVLVVGSGLGYWVSNARSSSESSYRSVAVERGELTQLASANGTINPVSVVNVGTQVSGTVKHWYADFNDKVVAGQKLLELDPALYQAQVNQSLANLANAHSQLKLARANEQRAQALFAQEYIARQDLDTAIQATEAAKAQVDLVEAQLTRDRTNLQYSIITSPVNGVIVSREVDIGQTVAASLQTPTLFKIARDLSKMQIDTSFAEADVGNLKIGQAVNFRVDAFPRRNFHGTVKQIRLNATIVQNVVTYDVVVEVDNPDLTLLPGMTAYVNIIVAQRKDTLMVPNAALRFRPAGARKPKGAAPGASAKQDAASSAPQAQIGTVYVLEAEQLKPVRVVVGITDNRMSEIVSGDLKEGDQVVVEDLKPNAGKPKSPSSLRMF